MKVYVAALSDLSCVLSGPQPFSQIPRASLADASTGQLAGTNPLTAFNGRDQRSSLCLQRGWAAPLSMPTVS
jgi:hypothetical protein